MIRIAIAAAASLALLSAATPGFAQDYGYGYRYGYRNSYNSYGYNNYGYGPVVKQDNSGAYSTNGGWWAGGSYNTYKPSYGYSRYGYGYKRCSYNCY